MKRPVFVAIILALVLAGCGTPAPDEMVIDLSHDGTRGLGFGDGPDPASEASRWQTFIASAGYPVLTRVEVKIRRFGTGTWAGAVRAELYTTDTYGRPAGERLAYGLIPVELIPAGEAFTVVETELYYPDLAPGNQYAVVLTQQTLTNAHYEWCKINPGLAGLHFGKYTVSSGWVDETVGFGTGWLKVHVAKTPKTPAYGPNLVANPGFESAAVWSGFVGGDPGRDSTNAYSGSYCLKFKNYACKQEITSGFKPGDEIKVSFMAKGTEPAAAKRVIISLTFNNGSTTVGGAQVDMIPPIVYAQKEETGITIPAGTNEIRLLVTHDYDITGWIYVDDIYLGVRS